MERVKDYELVEKMNYDNLNWYAWNTPEGGYTKDNKYYYHIVELINQKTERKSTYSEEGEDIILIERQVKNTNLCIFIYYNMNTKSFVFHFRKM